MWLPNWTRSFWAIFGPKHHAWTTPGLWHRQRSRNTAGSTRKKVCRFGAEKCPAGKSGNTSCLTFYIHKCGMLNTMGQSSCSYPTIKPADGPCHISHPALLFPCRCKVAISWHTCPLPPTAMGGRRLPPPGPRGIHKFGRRSQRCAGSGQS